jgi:hypothetical protein
MTRTPLSPDYRSDKMESLEGKAIARGRFLVFWDAVVNHDPKQQRVMAENGSTVIV